MFEPQLRKKYIDDLIPILEPAVEHHSLTPDGVLDPHPGCILLLDGGLITRDPAVFLWASGRFPSAPGEEKSDWQTVFAGGRAAARRSGHRGCRPGSGKVLHGSPYP